MTQNQQASPDEQADRSAAPSSEPSIKVELDIEDAPFLEEPEEEPEEKADEIPDPPPLPAGEEGKEKRNFLQALKSRVSGLLSNKKRLALVGGGVLLGLLLAGGALFFFSGDGAPEEPPVAEAPVPQAEETPPSPEPAPDPVFLFEAEPFFVELRGREGEIRFLHCRFSISTKNQNLFSELMIKNVAIRDAIYYYLSNKPLTFLENSQVGETLKRDLISVINEHTTAGKVEELYLDEYFVTRN